MCYREEVQAVAWRNWHLHFSGHNQHSKVNARDKHRLTAGVEMHHDPAKHAIDSFFMHIATTCYACVIKHALN
jgi:hypothetical protein